ncbi:cobalamin binding intrinsic factor-like [Scyliorhinus canicula]|uniref:cobalamin binding intrinsic factor-like n=1 Tax=Scyliorhinus canicula TaxID=7830 RepID=UPI0018F78A2C|nr:cobalamin binding intrinsic factor-like [Scyliorhinus canicula]
MAILALCLENEEIPADIAHSFVSFIVNLEAPESKNMSIGAKCNYILAMSCLLHSQTNPDIAYSRMQVAIELLLTDLTQNIQLNGSFGNAYETGIVIQVLNAKLGPRLAVAKNIYNCSQSLQSMIETIVNETPPDIMAVTAALPAMEGRSYLDIKHLCGSDDSPCPDTSNLGQEPPGSNATEDSVARRSTPTITLT